MVKKTNNTINARIPIKLKKIILELKKKQGNKTQQEVFEELADRLNKELILSKRRFKL